MEFTTAECIMYSALKVFGLDQTNKATHVATGFTMAFCVDGDQFIPALVTNRHVLCDHPAIALVLTRNATGRPDVGQTETVIISTGGAIYHPTDSVDLAILPIGDKINELKANGFNPFFSYLDLKLIPTQDQWDSFDAIEEVITAGFPEGLRDTVNNLPIIRSGITATHPAFNFNGDPDFLVDMPCFHGCSGSPVFIYNNGVYADPRKHEISMGKTRVFLLGVQYAIQTITKATEKAANSQKTGETAPTYKQLLNLGYVVKSSELLVFENLLRNPGK